MAFAKRSCGLAMVEFCFKSWDRLLALITRGWKVETVEDYVEQPSKTRLELLTEALDATYVCQGLWTPCAKDLLEVWIDSMIHSLKHGRSKGSRPSRD